MVAAMILQMLATLEKSNQDLLLGVQHQHQHRMRQIHRQIRQHRNHKGRRMELGRMVLVLAGVRHKHVSAKVFPVDLVLGISVGMKSQQSANAQLVIQVLFSIGQMD